MVVDFQVWMVVPWLMVAGLLVYHTIRREVPVQAALALLLVALVPLLLCFTFEHPKAFLLLALVPLFVWWGRGSLSDLNPFRRSAAIFLRLALLTGLVAALADPKLTWIHDDLAVIFLLDQSKSVPQKELEKAAAFIEKCAKKMGKKDRMSLLVFGTNASIETPFSNPFSYPTDFASVVSKNYTNIAEAIKLATAAFPEGASRRIVLLSDGNENLGHAVEEAKNARATGIAVDVYPFSYRHKNEVLMERLIASGEAAQGETVDLKVVVNALAAGEGTLSLEQNGERVTDAKDEKIRWDAGRTVFQIKRKLDKPSFYTFKARIESDDDTLPNNNEGVAYTVVRGEPRILFIYGQGKAKDLKEALGHHRPFLRLFKDPDRPDEKPPIDVLIDARSAENMPYSATEYQSYDTVILADVPRSVFTRNQMLMVESNVRDVGSGLIMIGGEESFGSGGYLGTPIEKALPVEMDISQRKVVPNGALVIILHSCEMPEGNSMGKDICKKAAETLAAEDFFGVIEYGPGGERWGVPLGPAADKIAIKGRIAAMSPGDSPDFDSQLKMAYAGLQKVKAGVKHIIMLSDWDPNQPPDSLLAQLVKDKITVSTVSIGEHNPSDRIRAQKIATRCGGKFYAVNNPKKLPEIFIKEAMVVKRGLVFEGAFVPQRASSSEILGGIPAEGFPGLNGYVLTTAKPKAQVPLVHLHKAKELKEPVADPILAHWRYGLGKTVAFTSDETTRWAGPWVREEAFFAKFWEQAVRWAMRTVSQSNYEVTTHIENGQGVATLEAIDSDGKFVDGLQPTGFVQTPGFNSEGLQFEQVAAGTYQAKFKAEEVGGYLITVAHEGTDEEQGGTKTTGATVSYSPEFMTIASNEALLHQMVRISGGRDLSKLKEPAAAVFKHDLENRSAPTDAWPAFLLVVLFLLPFDVANRRVAVSRDQVGWAFRKAFGWVPFFQRRKAAEPDAAMSALLRAKQRVREGQEFFKYQGPEGSGEAPFEGPASPGSGLPPRPGAPPPSAAGPPGAKPEAPAADSYTERLLKAKKRALGDK